MSQTAAGCSLCGCVGWHACTGRPLPPPTPEDEVRFTEALNRIFGKDSKEQCNALFPHVYTTSPQGEEQAPVKGSAEVTESSEGLT
jgi:hypothetical protein